MQILHWRGKKTSKIERGKIRAIWWLIAYISHFIFKPLMLLINNCPRHLLGHLSSVLHWIFSCLRTKFNDDPVISIVINVFDLIFKRLSSIFNIRMVRIIFFSIETFIIWCLKSVWGYTNNFEMLCTHRYIYM